MAGPVVQSWNRPVQNLMHILLAVSQRSADGDAVKGLGGDCFGAHAPQVLKPTALDDAVDGLVFVVIPDGLVRPIMGSQHGFLGVFVVGERGRTFVKSHDDVGIEIRLYLHRLFRIQEMPGSICHGLEGDAVVGDPGQILLLCNFGPFFGNLTGPFAALAVTLAIVPSVIRFIDLTEVGGVLTIAVFRTLAERRICTFFLIQVDLPILFARGAGELLGEDVADLG